MEKKIRNIFGAKVPIPLVLLVIVGIGVYFLLSHLLKVRAEDSAAAREIALEKPEIAECEQHLRLIYNAWKRYCADHKGAEPPSIECLIPKYISRTAVLVCPTADRWAKKGVHFNAGSVLVGKKSYPETYGFRWLASAMNAHDIRKEGNKAPLVVCYSHEEGVYRAVYHHSPPTGAFNLDQRGKWVDGVSHMYALVIRRDGTIGFLDPDDE